MVSTGFEWSLVVSKGFYQFRFSASTGFKWFPTVSIGCTGFEWFQQVSNGLSRFQMVSAGFEWSLLPVSTGFYRLQMVSTGFKWFALILGGGYRLRVASTGVGPGMVFGSDRVRYVYFSRKWNKLLGAVP